MTIKKVITGGCSFSVYSYPDLFNWVDILQNSLPNIRFKHTGLSAQGQELIQKKISLALIEELEYSKPEEIVVLVMWSGNERTAFYSDNKFFISDLVKNWENNKKYKKVNQLLDLKNEIPFNEKKKIADENGIGFYYNANNGWYSFNPVHDYDECNFIKEYNNISSTNLASIVRSLENIIFLQNLCKMKNVKIYQMFYMNNVFNDFLQHKNNINLNYLYKQLDHDTIISTVGLLDYLKNEPDNYKYFQVDNVHPNGLGSEKFTNEVIFPFLQSRNII